ncbi:MAG: hypothetical protein R6V85_09505 [Polyangia bacterium]
MRGSAGSAGPGIAIAAAALASLLVATWACDDDGGSGLDAVGQPCEVAADCYPQLDTSQLAGEVVCMDRVEGGYCTHHCQTDADCCAVEGECDPEYDLDYVCAPFESTGEKYCFISCEGQDDADDYCQSWAHHEFICRSTGGGDENRKVCVPEG